MTSSLEEKQLESLLFGSEQEAEVEVPEDIFEFVEDVEGAKKKENVVKEVEEGPVWVDPEDEKAPKTKRKYNQIQSTWEEALKKDVGRKRGRELFQSDVQIIQKSDISSSKFKSKDLILVPALDANKRSSFYGRVRSTDWHCAEPLFLATGGNKRKVKIFNIDGQVNKHLLTAKFATLKDPIAKFCHNRNEILVIGTNRHFYSLDIASEKKRRIPFLSGVRKCALSSLSVSRGGNLFAVCAESGQVFLATKGNKSFVRTLKMNGSALSADFSSCGNYLVTTGSDCSLYEWDLRRFACLSRSQDFASTCTNVVSVNPQDRRSIATGSRSGCVNIYKRKEEEFSDTRPLKEFLNIRSPITDVAFNTAGTLLAFCSDEVDNSLRIATMSDMSIVASFPRTRHQIEKASCLSFSKDNRYLSVGNSRGRCLLFRIENYSG